LHRPAALGEFPKCSAGRGDISSQINIVLQCRKKKAFSFGSGEHAASSFLHQLQRSMSFSGDKATHHTTQTSAVQYTW
jgi:hypothetical protein